MASLRVDGTHDANFVFFGGFRGCRYDNPRCHQTRQRWQFDVFNFHFLNAIFWTLKPWVVIMPTFRHSWHRRLSSWYPSTCGVTSGDKLTQWRLSIFIDRYRYVISIYSTRTSDPDNKPIGAIYWWLKVVNIFHAISVFCYIFCHVCYWLRWLPGPFYAGSWVQIKLTICD